MSAEGARVLEFLMEIENPSVEVKESVIAAVEWLHKERTISHISCNYFYLVSMYI